MKVMLIIFLQWFVAKDHVIANYVKHALLGTNLYNKFKIPDTQCMHLIYNVFTLLSVKPTFKSAQPN